VLQECFFIAQRFLEEALDERWKYGEQIMVLEERYFNGYLSWFYNGVADRVSFKIKFQHFQFITSLLIVPNF
jgi:hypothetical protein